MNLLRKEESPFLTDVAQYAGNHRGIQEGLMCWEIKDPSQKPFNNILEAVCQKVSQCRSLSRSKLLLIDIFLRGRTLETSAVYVMLAASTERQRKTAVKHLRRGSLLKEYPGLKIDHWDWPPHAPNVTMTGGKGKATDTELVYGCPRFEIRRLGSRTMHDAVGVPTTSLFSIVATNNGQNITRAGVLSCDIEVDQERFLIAPAHIFMPHPPEEPEEQGSDSESNISSEPLRSGSATPPDLDCELSSSRDSESLLTGNFTSSSSSTENDFELSRMNPPLTSSGNFRIFSLEHDYALIEVPHGQTFYSALRYMSPQNTLSIGLGQVPILVATPSLGIVPGLLDGRPTLMRLPYANKFSKLYPINLSCPISNGDCGSAVINQNTHQIYGFIVAASVEGRVAYISSADEIHNDITSKLNPGCSEFLPTSPEVTPNPPCNTLYVGNLPVDTREEELKTLFMKQQGYKRLCFRAKLNGPMCFVEFEHVSFATQALHQIDGQLLHNSSRGGIRLSFAKNPLGVNPASYANQHDATLLQPMRLEDGPR
ncbi:hypothetical protein FDECE_8754 [Fusarium decemcellulare]|nr:hypothetical protein FDECE_8754 [Fusarium decemcellulare]